VRNWIIKYTKGEKLITYSPKPEVYTLKSRKMTHEEKVEIVKACLANNLAYKEIVEKYQNIKSLIIMFIHGPKSTKSTVRPDSLMDEDVVNHHRSKRMKKSYEQKLRH